MKVQETQIRTFEGLVDQIDEFDIGARAAVILTNLQVNRAGAMDSRPGYLLVSFEEG